MKFSARIRAIAMHIWAHVTLMADQGSRASSQIDTHDFVMPDGSMYTTKSCATCVGGGSGAFCTCAAMMYIGDGNLHPDQHTVVKSCQEYYTFEPDRFTVGGYLCPDESQLQDASKADDPHRID